MGCQPVVELLHGERPSRVRQSAYPLGLFAVAFEVAVLTGHADVVDKGREWCLALPSGVRPTPIVEI
jgi:hypothetical protein